jgi:hypothetical protein
MIDLLLLKTAPRLTDEIRYSRGCSTFDNCPKQHRTISFTEFGDRILADKSLIKGQAYVCSPLSTGPHDQPGKYAGLRTWRIKSRIEPVRFLVFDLDGFGDPRDWERLQLILQAISGFAYETSSSTPGAPRARVVLELNRLVSAQDRQKISIQIEMALRSSLGVDFATFDRSVYLGCQPFYTPVGEPASYIFRGEPIDADFYLNDAAALEAEVDVRPSHSDLSILETPPNIERLTNALSSVSADVDRNDWMKIVWSIAAHRWTCGESIAREWSKKAPERFDEAGFQNVWGSFNSTREPRITANWIYDIASKLGWADPKPSAPHPAFEFIHLGSVINQPSSTRWVIKDVIPAESQLFLVGDPKAGKSLMAFDWATCVASGTAWHRHSVTPGGVLILAGEGQQGIVRRMRAISSYYDRDLSSAPIGFSRTGARLCDPAGLDEVLAACDAFAEAYVAPSLIIIDTLHRNMGGADENSAADMSRYFDHIDRLRYRFGASVITVHHSGHGAKDRARGSSAIMAGVDVLYLMKENKLASSQAKKVVTLSCDKNKDGEELRDLHFSIQSVALPLLNGELESATSVVLEEHSGDVLVEKMPLTDGQEHLFAALGAIAANDDDFDHETIKTAFTANRKSADPGLKDNTITQSFGRAIEQSLNTGLLDRSDKGYKLTPKGRQLTRRPKIQP